MTTRSPSLIRKSADTLSNDGLAGFLAKTYRCIRDAVLVTNAADWYCAELAHETARIPEPPGATIDFDATDELIEWMADIRGAFDWIWVDEELEAAREHQHILPLIRSGGTPAGYIMIGTTEAYVTDFKKRIRIPAATAFIYDTFVHPDFRGRGVAAWAVVGAMNHLRQRGIRQLWCHIPRWNRASIRTYEKCGFARICFIRHFRILGIRMSTRSPETIMKERATENAKR